MYHVALRSSGKYFCKYILIEIQCVSRVYRDYTYMYVYGYHNTAHVYTYICNSLPILHHNYDIKDMGTCSWVFPIDFMATVLRIRVHEHFYGGFNFL